jgi:hypothetical protein
VKQQLIEQLKNLGRGRIDAAEAIAELLMPEPTTFDVSLPTDELIAAVEADTAKKKKAK